ncbi:MAG TPA: hypothetical protein VFH45_08380 [Acidimicrobiales bacterium]|nr:hypothetical protein [Acidimicrobiales bacterium]
MDGILTAGGLVLTVFLAIAGSLLLWGYHFANNSVHDQLAREQIFVPALGSKALASPEIGPYLNQYAGQQVVNGAQAEAYANHFIAVHLKEIGGGQTYAQLSAKAQADPTNTKLAGTVQTVFRGETLRGLLLNAYAFWQFGQIALWAAIASFIGAAAMLVLTILGFLHLRKTTADEEFVVPEHMPKSLVGA